jgi:ABC-type nitrate/sulfonate/bicarbonate transport system substrate-binding protein
MDKKIIAVILVVAVIAVAAVAIVMTSNSPSNPESKDLNIVGRVNSEGSGILLNPDVDPTTMITVEDKNPGYGSVCRYDPDTGKYYVFHKEGWIGKVIATPGTSTIQHVQLAELAKDMGLTFKSYSSSTEEPNTLYYVANVGTFADYVNVAKTSPVSGYIIWEAQYSIGLENGYTGLATTNNLFHDHTCCIIGSSVKYMENNKDAFLTFLNVYTKAVDKINAALANKSSADYKSLVDIAVKRVTMPDSMTDAQKKEAIENALVNVTYLYADDSTGALTNLKEDVGDLAKSLYQSGAIDYSALDLGFSGYIALGDKFVNDKYMKDAIAGKYSKLDSQKTIRVAAIKGDIHQIALWFAIDTGMFDGTNLKVEVSQQTNGPGVFMQLSNGESDVGFLGAPPMTIRTMNAKLITP